MEYWKIAEDAAEKIGILKAHKMGISHYGIYENINVRISNHLPKVHNLVDYKKTLIENENDQIDLLFLVFSSDAENQKNLEDEICEELKHVTDKNVNVYISVENDFSLSYFQMLIRTKF